MRFASLARKETTAPAARSRSASKKPLECSAAPPIVHDVLNSPGQPLDSRARSFFEPKFGYDLSNVRLHYDVTAAQSAASVNAEAYTVGNDVVFGCGTGPTNTTLLAHELTHVVQQNQAPSSAIDAQGSCLEAEAEHTASEIVGGSGFTPVLRAAKMGISRQQPPTATVPPSLNFLTPQDIVKLQSFGQIEYQSSIDTLEKMLRTTGDLTQEGAARQFVGTRQASGELRTFLDFIRNPNVQGLKVVPSAAGGRSPDFYYREVGGDEGRVEVVNITAAAKKTRAELRPNASGGVSRRIPRDGGAVVNTVEDINTVSKLREAIRVKIKPGSQLSAQNSNTLVAGGQMQIGGEVRVSTSHIELSRGEIDGVIRDLQSELAGSDATRIVIDTIDSADARAGRKLFEYLPDQQRRFSFDRVRTSFAQQPAPGAATASPAAPATGAATDLAADVSGDAASAAGKALGKAEEQVAEHALQDAAAARVKKLTTQAVEKDLAEVTTEAFTKSATSAASRRLGKAVTPVIGAVFAIPDAWKGMQDLAHGDIVTGLGTIGVAIIDVASQGLHLTDEITAGGGTILAITIQTWAATMQFGFETARIQQRASELKAYMKAHGNQTPSRDELMSYYGLNDEDLLLLQNDIYKAGQNKVISTEDLAKQVRALLAQIDANANKPLPEGVTPEGIQMERASLSKLLMALDADVQRQRAQASNERAAAEEKRRQTNFDRAQQQQKRAAAAPATSQLPPGPGASQQQPAAAGDPFGVLSPRTPQPLNGISMENAELAGTGSGRIRNILLDHYRQMESEHFPSDKVKVYQNDVTTYISNLDRMIAEFMKKGSSEWPGVKEMRRLRDAADNEDRSKLMR